MTLQEFKAWFEGYTEAMDSTPNEKQWNRIKERVRQIDGQATTVRHFYDYYWWPPRLTGPYWQWPQPSSPLFTTSVSGINSAGDASLMQCAPFNASESSVTTCFAALGTADFAGDAPA